MNVNKSIVETQPLDVESCQWIWAKHHHLHYNAAFLTLNSVYSDLQDKKCDARWAW